MRRLGLSGLIIGLLLAAVVPVSAAPLTGGTVGIASTVVCKDTATVAVSGTAAYATNRVKVRLYKQNSNGSFEWFRTLNSENFGSGNYLMALIVDYSTHPVAAGRVMRIDVQLQRLSGGTFVDDGGLVSTTIAAADQSCKDKCSVTIATSDRAPVKGTVTLRTHFGAWFRPEGRLYGAIPVNAGVSLRNTVIGVPCGASVRVWYYPATGKDRTPKLLPAQYWPNEYAATELNGTNPYTTSFAKGLAATKPLESDDPYAPK
jgi:hypothetical protein